MSKKFFVFAISSLFLFMPTLVGADMGMIPFEPVTLDESAQNAIVGWNNKEEIIILSTDVRSTGATPVLRILPLPANPSKVVEGSFDSFNTMVDFYNEKTVRYPSAKGDLETLAEPVGIEITFHEKIGAHDVTVVKVNDFSIFLSWVEHFAEKEGLTASSLSENFISAVEDYLWQGIQFFVFDLIEANQTSQSINPLVYRFPASELYYPMAITAYSDVGSAWSEIDLFIVTRGVLESRNSIYNAGLSVGSEGYGEDSVLFSQAELKIIDSELASLFDRGGRVTYLTYRGYLSSLVNDLVVPLSDIYIALEDGDLVKTPASGAVYFIQNGIKHVFGHLAVYESWGYQDDFGLVFPVSESNLSDYPGAEHMPFREGTLFRGVSTSLHGKAASCVFVVEDGKVRPIKSAEIYQDLYKDPEWKNVKWIPDDYLTKFSYPLGAEVTSSDVHPDGTLIKRPDSDKIYLVEDGKIRHIENWQALIDNRYYDGKNKEFTVPFVITGKSYPAGEPIIMREKTLSAPEFSASSNPGCPCRRG